MAIWVINAFHNLKCMVNAYPYFFLLVDYTISPIVYKHLWQSLFLWLTLVLAKLYAFHALDSIYPPPPYTFLLFLLCLSEYFLWNKSSRKRLSSSVWLYCSFQYLPLWYIYFSILYQLAFGA